MGWSEWYISIFSLVGKSTLNLNSDNSEILWTVSRARDIFIKTPIRERLSALIIATTVCFYCLPFFTRVYFRMFIRITSCEYIYVIYVTLTFLLPTLKHYKQICWTFTTNKLLHSILFSFVGIAYSVPSWLIVCSEEIAIALYVDNLYLSVEYVFLKYNNRFIIHINYN